MTGNLIISYLMARKVASLGVRCILVAVILLSYLGKMSSFSVAYTEACPRMPAVGKKKKKTRGSQPSAQKRRGRVSNPSLPCLFILFCVALASLIFFAGTRGAQ